MSSTDLIARLRGAWLDDAEERCLVSDAADALTAQAATIAKQARELEALRADAERLNKELIECRQNQ